MTIIDNIVQSFGLKQLVIDHGKPCGDCQECCTTFQIQALGKPSLSRCQHPPSDG